MLKTLRLLKMDTEAEVFAVIVGKSPIKLQHFELLLPSEAAAAILRDGSAVFFNWNSERARYERTVESGRERLRIPQTVLLPSFQEQHELKDR
jgi:hypothetical protein